MPQTIHNKKNPASSIFLFINLAVVFFAATIFSLIALASLNISSRSPLVGLMLGLTTTLLIVSPFLYNHQHRRILREQSMEIGQQVRANIRLYASFLIITFLLSVLFSFVHRQFLAVFI